MTARADARVVVVAQARMSSSRLPGKVLTDLGPGTALELVLRRLRSVIGASEVVIATSTESDDDPVAEAARVLGHRAVRGPLDDVLERYRMAAAATGADAVVRVTADCPLVEPTVVDRLVTMWRGDVALDYVWNTREPRTFPDGLDVEVVSHRALEQAAEETRDPYDREHVTPFVRDRPVRFPQRSLRLDPPARAVKLSLDTSDDLITIRSFIKRVGSAATLDDIVAAAGGAPARMVTE
jgi:spore coat polysaccharide biosynthesis protein SpsF